MANNDKFRASFKKRIEKSKSKFELFVRKLVIEIDQRLVNQSPVGNPSLWKVPRPHVGGRFRANWQVGNGSPNLAISSDTLANEHAPIINSIKVNGQTIYLTNALPYAERLANGWSKQAQVGWIDLIAVEADMIARSIGTKVKAL